MLDELIASSNLLHAALERYWAACLTIQRSYTQGDKHHTTSELALRMDSEAEFAASLEVKLQEAKAAIEWSRNRSRYIAINDLPSEVLAHIFHLVLSSQPCAKKDYLYVKTDVDMVYPVTLSHVCSYWRKITFGTVTLWSHIDISTSATLNQRCLNRLAQLHLDHAGQTPVELHVFDSRGYPASPFGRYDPLHALITQLLSRTFSFNLDANQTYDCAIHGGILSTLLEGSVAGKLVQITMRHGNIGHSVIRGKDDLNSNPEDVRVDLSTEQLDVLLSSVSILRLERMYSLWNSRAYQGLVELRLKGMYSSIYITEVELVGILRSSPGLRVLELGIEIDDPLPIDAQVTEVFLESLEALDVSQTRCYWYATLLRWLTPGPKALQLILHRGRYQGLEVKRSLGPFLSRSYVTRVYETGLKILHIIELLELCPNLQELAISRIDAHIPDPLRVEDIGGTALAHLDHLYITGVQIHIEDIVTLLSIPTFAVKRVVFYDCTLLGGGSLVTRNQGDTQLEELYRNNPDVEFIQWTDIPSPIKGWNAFE
ncbi:unnamed protein product [Rhizoctonia solani]|uniref:F-box domain-containing protein n=1 Tax=Rhizoctonia solani TaxID=456999 RepID=A0A8H3AZE2_9AGAM|nr:unnamed protein product [Rhizoctonia solani]